MVTEEFTLLNKAHFRLMLVIWVHASERFDAYYVICSKTPSQVANFTSYVIMPESITY